MSLSFIRLPHEWRIQLSIFNVICCNAWGKDWRTAAYSSFNIVLILTVFISKICSSILLGGSSWLRYIVGRFIVIALVGLQQPIFERQVGFQRMESQQSFVMRRFNVWGNENNIIQIIEHFSRLPARDFCHGKQRNSPFYLGSESSFHVLKQSDSKNRERENSPSSILHPKKWFLTLLNCVKTELCFLHIQLVGTNVWLSKCSTQSRFWVLKISPQNRSLEIVPACIVSQYYRHDNILCIHMCDECVKSIETGVCHKPWSI